MTKKFNTSGRLFTFGHSCTQYYWPTWADIVGTCWQEFENWGRLGVGNLYIFNAIVECDARNNFNENDTVLIRWAPISRLDYYQYNDWGVVSKKFPTENQPDYPASCPRGYTIITCSYIRAIDSFLKTKKVEFKMWNPLGMRDSEITKFYLSGLDTAQVPLADVQKLGMASKSLKTSMFSFFDDRVNDLQKKLYNRLSGPSWPSLKDILKDSYTVTPAIQTEINEFLKILENDKKINSLNFKNDHHPGPLGHLHLIKYQDYFKDLTIPDATIQWITEMDQKLTRGEKIIFDSHLPKNRL